MTDQQRELLTYQSIDLFVVVHDEEYAEIVADRYGYMARLDEPELILEAPQNWPPGGVYNMALYPGEYGPYQADEASPRATSAFLSKAQCKLTCLLSTILTA